jgi:selenocysteine lyase/cysteine desulfurase
LTLKGGLNLIERIGNGDLKIGFKRISNRIIELTTEFISYINKLDFTVITPLEIENRSGIITLEHKNAEEIYNELIKNKIYISLRNYPGSSKKQLLRFSFNYYNNLEDIEKSISILKKFK